MPEAWWVKRGVETHLVWNQIRNHRALFLSKIWSSKCVKCQVLVLFRELQLPSSTITVWRPAMFSLLYACWNTIVVCSQGYRVQVHPLHYGTPFFFYFGSEHSKCTCLKVSASSKVLLPRARWRHVWCFFPSKVGRPNNWVQDTIEINPTVGRNSPNGSKNRSVGYWPVFMSVPTLQIYISVI